MAEILAFQTGYKDLDLRMKLHPVYGDVRPVKDVDAIKNSIKNILLTKRGERPFNPLFGCDLTNYLFEPVDVITTGLMEEEIRYSIGQHEPRVELKEVYVTDDPDRNAYNITLELTIINAQQDADLTLILERLR
jgi:phage baseplate assembly protein W